MNQKRENLIPADNTLDECPDIENEHHRRVDHSSLLPTLL